MTWLSGISPRLKIVWHGRWKAGRHEPARYLYDHELVVVTRGSCEVRLGNKVQQLGAGEFLIVPPDTLHVTTTGSQGVERHCFHFDWVNAGPPPEHPFCCFYPARPARGEIIRAPAFVPRRLLHGACPGDGSVRQLIETIHHRWRRDEALVRETARAVFLELLLRLLWRPGQKTRPDDRRCPLAHAVKDLLDQSGIEQRGIQEQLASLGFSYPHLCRLFRRTFGVTPVEYRNAIRLEHAKALLRDSRYSISEVAYESGFQDPGYFTRVFRRQNGQPPSAFQR